MFLERPRVGTVAPGDVAVGVNLEVRRYHMYLGKSPNPVVRRIAAPEIEIANPSIEIGDRTGAAASRAIVFYFDAQFRKARFREPVGNSTRQVLAACQAIGAFNLPGKDL